MKSDELEATAREIVLWFYDKDENATDGLIRTLKDKIYNALKTLRSKTRKEDAEIARNTSSNGVGMCVCGQCVVLPVSTIEIAQAILKKDEEELK